MGCGPGKNAQLAVLRARYQVPGTQAAAVEEYFMRTSKMPALRFVCCGWENVSGYGTLTSGNGDEFTVTMHSVEGPYTDREQWRLIPWFYVTVEFYLEKP